MKKDILKILLGIFVGFTIANGYFVISGDYPVSPVEAIPYNFTTGAIAVVLGLIITGVIAAYLKKEIETLNLKYASQILVGFFLFGLLTFIRNGAYPAAGICLVLTCIFTYTGFFRK